MTAIDDKHAELGGAGFFGDPLDAERTAADGIGRYRHFANASIYWSPATGAHEVHGAILGRWAGLGAEAFLGYPVTDETVAADGVGRFGLFERGAVYWSPATGAHEVYGAILATWQGLGAERSSLGYPVSGERPASDGGRFGLFQNGTVRWTPAAGTAVGVGAAFGLVGAFGAAATPSPWRLPRVEVADRLAELVAEPDLVRQAGLNLCGPAAFLRAWLEADPAAVVRFAAELYDTGRSRIGSYEVEPDSDSLLGRDYAQLVAQYGPGAMAPPAEWMILGSLRDAGNAVFDYEGTPDEDASAFTTPGELEEWLSAARCFAEVRDEGNWFFTKGLDHARALAPSERERVVVLLNTNAMAPRAGEDGLGEVGAWVLDRFPNHYVMLESPVALRADDHVEFTYWQFGHRRAQWQTAVVPRSRFEDNYYGAVVARR